MKPENPVPRSQLGRAEWITAATCALADKGVAGMCVEVLAKGFGVTKGSFYWHFRDRHDLIDAVLENWKESRIREADCLTAAVPGNERDQLRRIIAIYSANRHRAETSTELAVRDWARRDARAAAAVEAVDAYRIERTCRLFGDSGLAAAEARSRSILLYAFVLGQCQMGSDEQDSEMVEAERWITNHIVAN